MEQTPGRANAPVWSSGPPEAPHAAVRIDLGDARVARAVAGGRDADVRRQRHVEARDAPWRAAGAVPAKVAPWGGRPTHAAPPRVMGAVARPRGPQTYELAARRAPEGPAHVYNPNGPRVQAGAGPVRVAKGRKGVGAVRPQTPGAALPTVLEAGARAADAEAD